MNWKMKKIVIVLVFSLLSMASFSQETNAYAFFVNVVNDNFKFPLVGFVNVAKGNHKGLQLGFVNWNARNFAGSQVGYVNTIGNNLNGVQCGFVNTTIQQMEGAQVGFVNTAMQDATGAQVGFVNTALQSISRAQIGFVNTAMKKAPETQVGFVNIANRKENGLQLGFVNYADTIGDGIPIGFLSFVRRGGYKAIEYSFSEFFPVTVGFKTGVEKFYTSIYLAYNPSAGSTKSMFANGIGFGSIIPLKNAFFFNPEVHSMNTIEIKNNRQLTSFVPYFGYNFNYHFSITAGPSVVWSASFDKGVLLKPVFNIANFEIDDKNSIFVGARVNVRCRF